MKTAVSIPDNVFKEADLLAQQMKKSRSELYSHALTEYLARHVPDRVTEAMDKVCAEMDEGIEVFVQEAALQILKQSEW